MERSYRRGGAASGVTIQQLCRAVGMSRQNYYRKRRQRQRRHVEEQVVLELVREERRRHPRMGVRKLYAKLAERFREHGIRCGRDRLFEILRRAGLLVPRRRRRARTTDSRHSWGVHPNRLRQREVRGPHEAWVADLTYLRTDEGFVYLALISDVYSRKIVGWDVADGLEATGCCRALAQALEQLPAARRPLHHSDRGTQYSCELYQEILRQWGLEGSMTEQNHCYENAQAERLNGILKQEYGLGGRFRTKRQAREAVAQAIWLYNEERPHLSLGYRTPAEVHAGGAAVA